MMRIKWPEDIAKLKELVNEDGFFAEISETNFAKLTQEEKEKAESIGIIFTPSPFGSDDACYMTSKRDFLASIRDRRSQVAEIEKSIEALNRFVARLDGLAACNGEEGKEAPTYTPSFITEAWSDLVNSRLREGDGDK